MDSPSKPLAQRLGWFALIWVMSVVALATNSTIAHTAARHERRCGSNA